MIKVAIVEDDSRIRESLAVLIDGAEGFRCIAACPNAEVALKQLPGNWPDVLLMDINLPGMLGIECVLRLKKMQPSLLVLMLTISDDNQQIFDSLKAGATGYLLKKTPAAEILEAIADIHSGGAPMSSSIARKVVKCFQQPSPEKPESLSRREQEILTYLARGYQNKEIAEALGLSPLTISAHVKSIYEKLHVHSRTEAVVKYLSGGKEM
jgi:DNA-binding NarL/FixJ family response regulator